MNNQNDIQQLLSKFIGSRTNYYLNTKAQRFSLHWAGLFFGSLWLLYRKMYFNFFVVLAWAFIIGVIGGVIGINLRYMYWIGFIPNIILFIYGKKIYLNFATQRVKQHLNHPIYSEKVFLELGRTNWSVPFLWLFIQIIGIIMLSLPYVSYTL